MPVASQVAERLKIRKIRLKDQNNLKTSWNYDLVPSLPLKKKILSILAKDYSKMEIVLFP